MSEAELREGLRAAVGDEPPLRFDADELIQRARHVRKRRRALVAVAVVTLALTGTVLSLPGLFEPRPGLDAASGHVLTTTPASSAAPAPSPTSSAVPQDPVPEQPATTEQRADVPPKLAAGAGTRLSVYLTQRFAEVVPDVKVQGTEFVDVDKQPGYLTGWVSFVDRFGSSQVLVRLTTPPSRVTRDEFCTEIGCDEAVRRQDGTYLLYALPTTASNRKLVTHTVAHLRADGSAVQVSGYNFDPTTGSVVRAEVALTVDQLVALATDPKLAVS
ncbi:hypothetical protein [Saccharothrix stipae]